MVIIAFIILVHLLGACTIKAADQFDQDIARAIEESVKTAEEENRRWQSKETDIHKSPELSAPVPEIDTVFHDSARCNQFQEHIWDKSQYNYGDKEAKGMGVSCGGIALSAADALEATGWVLPAIHLDAVLRAGNRFYQQVIAHNPHRKPGYLLLNEIKLEAARTPHLHIKHYDYAPKQFNPALIARDEPDREAILNDMKTNMTFGEVFALMEQQKSNLYALFTLGQTTIMIGYSPDRKKFVLFDSHRKDKFEGQGSGYHIFSRQADLACYLTDYPGLKTGKNLNDQSIVALLFEPKILLKEPKEPTPVSIKPVRQTVGSHPMIPALVSSPAVNVSRKALATQTTVAAKRVARKQPIKKQRIRTGRPVKKAPRGLVKKTGQKRVVRPARVAKEYKV